MKNRIQQHAPNLPQYIKFDELLDEELVFDEYNGAGNALLVTTGDKILDLVYFDNMHDALDLHNHAICSGAEVWFGSCSCYSFCNPVELPECTLEAAKVIEGILAAEEQKEWWA
tara:strand:- start:104 stop:445 length:342 start_codon:yes stop_codon:yes gene_type:complete